MVFSGSAESRERHPGRFAALCWELAPGAEPSCRTIYRLGAELGLTLNGPQMCGVCLYFLQNLAEKKLYKFPRAGGFPPLSSALALCSALGPHNSFHKYLLHNMTGCQKRPRAARKSPGKTIITHLRFFFVPSSYHSNNLSVSWGYAAAFESLGNCKRPNPAAC